MTRLISAVAVVAMLTDVATFARQDAPDDVLAVRYMDGRVSQQVVRAQPGGFWTPRFPRTANWAPPAGELEVTALRLGWVRVDGGVRVTISVLRGTSHQGENEVATIVVRPGTPVVIDALRKFGAEPIELSLTMAPSVTLKAPQVITAAPDLVVENVGVVTSDGGRVVVALRNDAPKAVRTIYVEARRGVALATSGRRSGQEGRPLIPAAGGYEIAMRIFRQTAPNFAAVPSAIDVINITAIIYQDGTSAGDPIKVEEFLLADYGNAVQLGRVVAAYRRAVTELGADFLPHVALERLRTTIDALAIDVDDALVLQAHMLLSIKRLDDARMRSSLRIDQQAIKTQVQSDLKALRAGRGAGATSLERVLAAEADRYEAWRTRLSVSRKP